MMALACLVIGQAENWPGFRGPRGDGTSTETVGGGWRLLWKTPLPGPGHSSPIVWNDRIFVTAFEPERSFWGLLMGQRGRLLVLCLDKTTGKLRWQREVRAEQIERTTSVNQPASPTPVTDGKSLFVYFGSFGLLAFDFEGTRLWEHKLGPFRHHMGVGSSPVLLEDRVLLNVETDGPAFLLAVATGSGETIWEVPRKVRQAGYSSPFVWKQQIILAGHRSLKAYGADNGRELWTTGGLSDYVVPTPVADDDFLYVTSSGPGGSIVMAVREDGSVAWRSSRGAAYVASPLHVSGLIFTINHGAIVSCLAAANGEMIWQERLEEAGNYYASPVAAGGLLYFVSESGQVSVIAAESEYRLVSTRVLGERVLASPAISEGSLFLRSDQHLFAFAISEARP
jgi:hypothetical protein